MGRSASFTQSTASNPTNDERGEQQCPKIWKPTTHGLPMNEDNQPHSERVTLTNTIRILQLNLNKSDKAHLELINSDLGRKYDIILIQEPYTTAFNAIRTPANFRPVYPKNRFVDDAQIRSVTWVNRELNTNYWESLDIPDTNDVTAIRIKGSYGNISIFNVYNDCTHRRTETTIRRYLRDNAQIIGADDNQHMVWAGDFNRHHPLWDRDEDTHLFTTRATRMAENLINLIAENNMVMPLPKGIPTLQHMRTKRYSRPDNVFCTEGLQDSIISCNVVEQDRPNSTDHFPIATTIDIPQRKSNPNGRHNFREVEWTSFRKRLVEKLSHQPAIASIENEAQLNEATLTLVTALQDTINQEVKISQPRPESKRWWNSDLKEMKKELNRIRLESFKFRTITHHPSHRTLRAKSKDFGEAIIRVKREHWENYLEEMTADDIWIANRYLREPIGDGGSPRIPTLRSKDEDGNEITLASNEEKANIFGKTFFPPPPTTPTTPTGYQYPEPLPDPEPLTKEQILRQVKRLSPYKAHGPDGIPNVVLQRCIDIIVDRLLTIYQAILQLNLYYDPWREFTTVVLRKPSKPSYEIPKAYRPVVLLPTLAKVLTAIVADILSQLVEKHRILPNTHFGGRPGRTTTDAIHYLTHKIKDAWKLGLVASILFLDIEGAFPNAVTDRLIHNLKKRRVPTKCIDFIKQILTNRRTRVQFDDYASEVIWIKNGIGQGDPLSMILYILYNADLLEITGDAESEDAIGYVDDIAIIATGRNFVETTRKIDEMMTKDEGGITWSKEHNSKFEASKSAIMHATRRIFQNEGRNAPVEKPVMKLAGHVIKEVDTYKYLGIIIDSKLLWNEQEQRTIANATKWLLQYRRLTKPSTGVSARLMRRLYVSVAIPKITYGVDTWYTPPTKPAGQTKNSGSAGALRKLQKVQRIATLAITGALRSSPTDLVDIHAGILPIELTILKVCHRAIARMLTLSHSHPLHRAIEHARLNPPSKHLSQLDLLLKVFRLHNLRMETITPFPLLVRNKAKFTTTKAASRKESIAAEIMDDADFKIFTDGSGIGGEIGAAAILYRKGRRTPVRSLKAYLGHSSDHNTYEAEVVGILLATWLIRQYRETIGKRVTIYTDNQAIVSAVLNVKKTSGQYLVQAVYNSINSLESEIRIAWISGHSEVHGNEAVDKLAKEAAEGRASSRDSLPPMLRKDLPTSLSAFKQEYLGKLFEKWETSWTRSSRKFRMETVNSDFPFNSYRNRLQKLTRGQASMIVQILIGHFPLNTYLHRIGKSATKLCEKCGEEGMDGRVEETIKHFIFHCDAYIVARVELTTKIGADDFNLESLLSTARRMKALIKYIGRTRRFKNEDIRNAGRQD
jgi:ribonuclease HI/endonuclease/exonuclease/phosphatase family metal-dependent hydrolase